MEQSKNGISASIIADSLTESGHRLTTFICVFPRIVLAEFNTHRMLSRNSASSRAIPFPKMLRMVKENPFIPIAWMQDHKGMQGNKFFTDETVFIDERNWKVTDYLLYNHLLNRDNAVKGAIKASNSGLTKQIVNRYLEPFLYHTCICTGTEWENFFALRAHPDAEIHIADLAHKMLDAYNESTPKKLEAGEWHIPFGDQIDYSRLGRDTAQHYKDNPEEIVDINKWLVKVATARCARVSYLNFEGKDSYEADIKLHDQLLQSGHMSPFEHCARAMSHEEFAHWTNYLGYSNNDIVSVKSEAGWCGNFRGFIQYRKTIVGENKNDLRVKVK